MLLIGKRDAAVFYVLFVGFIASAPLSGCAGQKKIVDKPTPAYRQVQVIVANENLRDAPSGNKIGVVKEGESFSLMMRRGNWCLVGNNSFEEVWIWAPSVGLPSVNPLHVSSWLGSGGGVMDVDQLMATFGPQDNVTPIASQAVVYQWKNAGSLFGTRHLVQVDAWVDRTTRSVVKVRFELPPYQGQRAEVLDALGVPQRKADKTDFTQAIYTDVRSGIGFLSLAFANGDFMQVGEVIASRYDPALVEKWIAAPEKKFTIEDQKLVLEVTLLNRSESLAFSCPVFSTTLVENGRQLGTWQIGPGDVRLDPGERKTFRIPLPLNASQVSVKQVAARADLIEMLVVPSAKDSG